MSLRALVAKAAQNALKAVGDLKDTATFERVTIGQYNPVTDAQVENIVSVSVAGVFTNEKTKEGETENVDSEDRRFVISSLDLGFEPLADSSVVIAGARYQIIKVRRVPGRAIYILTLRLT